MTEERDIQAAEYVLGTLPADERAAVAAQLPRDAELAAAVRFWETRLAALDASATPRQPPEAVWEAVERRIAERRATPATPTGSAEIIQLRRRVAVWRGATAAAALLAAALAIVTVLDRRAVAPPTAAARYVAVVDTGGHEPALVAEVDTATGIIRIRSLAAATPPGRSLELWHIPEGQSPRSLGVLQAGAEAQTIRDALAAGPVGGLIAVTVEPEGGSPSGAPTSAPIYSGRLIPVE